MLGQAKGRAAILSMVLLANSWAAAACAAPLAFGGSVLPAASAMAPDTDVVATAPVASLRGRPLVDAGGIPNDVSRSPGRVLRVGPQRLLRKPSQAAAVARDGDIIEIDAGVYRNDYAFWRQNNLVLRGVGGMAHLQSAGMIPNGKAIWVLDGDSVTIENIEFSGAAVRHTNGAGIRHQGGRLVLLNTFFHDNEFSVLTGALPGADIEISNSRFWNHRRPVRHSHGIYIGKVRSLELIGNHFKGTDKGHQVKSRARRNLIAYNRIEDVEGGTSSRLIDLSNCGFSVIIGNQIHQAPTSQNLNAIGYGPEGCEGLSARHKRLYVVHNTFVNTAPAGEFVRNFADGAVVVSNNLIFGAGQNLAGPGQDEGNVRLAMARAPADRWSAIAGDAVVDAARPLAPVEGVSLVPLMEFSAPLGVRSRPVSGLPDVGASEYVR